VSVEINLRFAGQYYDSETGLHYNYHRYYDPSTGRYLTADPIGSAGGINLYNYVGGNPVNMVDPFGLYAWYDEFNVFDPNSTMSKQSIGIWNGIKGTYFSLAGNDRTANESFRIAGANSGHSLLE
jgi:RHS repeat-associated protein